MFDVFVCTNLVNYAVAVQGVGIGARRPAIVLYEPWRFRRQPLARGWHLPIGIWSLRLLVWLGRLRLLDTLYIPHDRFNKRVAAAARKARVLAYLDDGLDTLRHSPRNFDDAVESAGRPDYFTFSDYRQLPAWLGRFNVRPTCAIRQLADVASLQPMALDGIDNVFVESPGLRPAEVIEALGLDPGRVLVVRHPVQAKRGEVPAGCRTVPGTEFNPEATLLAARGKTFYFGETMALVFALHTEAARRNTLRMQLDTQQQANLASLPLLPAGEPRLPQLLKPGF